MTKVHRIAIFSAIVICAICGLWITLTPKLNPKNPDTAAASVIRTNKTLTPFQLIDTNGNTFTERSFRGHWSLIFFGYVNCPDICPATLNLVKDVWNTYLPTKQPPARFLFASILPNLDPSSTLQPFLHNYNSQFIGLTGEQEEMNKLMSQLGIFSNPENIDPENSQLSTFNHSAVLMLIDPHATLRAVFSPPLSAENIVADLDLLTQG